MTILFTTRLPENGFHLPDCELVIPESPYFSEEELMLRIGEADILVSTFDFTVSSALLSQGKQLRLVANFGVGFNNIDIAYCQAHHCRKQGTCRIGLSSEWCQGVYGKETCR